MFVRMDILASLPLILVSNAIKPLHHHLLIKVVPNAAQEQTRIVLLVPRVHSSSRTTKLACPYALTDIGETRLQIPVNLATAAQQVLILGVLHVLGEEQITIVLPATQDHFCICHDA